MPPKVKITKESIVDAAMALVRQNGAQAINARTIAAALGCSTQPVFSNFVTMEALRNCVLEKAATRCQDYVQQSVAEGIYPPYKASGIGYIRFAKEEKELFRFLYMRQRTDENIPTELNLFTSMETVVHNNTGLAPADARLFHLEMWAYVHGIAAMLATGYLDLEWELISKMLTDAYLGLKKQYEAG